MQRIKLCFALLLLILIIGFLQSNELTNVSAWQWFDTYDTKISWNDEQAHLYNFAVHLEKNPDHVGYIAFYTGEKDNPRKLKSQVNRAKNYLISKLNINENRLIIVNAKGNYDESLIVLQPILKNAAPPNF